MADINIIDLLQAQKLFIELGIEGDEYLENAAYLIHKYGYERTKDTIDAMTELILALGIDI